MFVSQAPHCQMLPPVSLQSLASPSHRKSRAPEPRSVEGAQLPPTAHCIVKRVTWTWVGDSFL
jgi:hypothetical protein